MLPTFFTGFFLYFVMFLFSLFLAFPSAASGFRHPRPRFSETMKKVKEDDVIWESICHPDDALFFAEKLTTKMDCQNIFGSPLGNDLN